MLLKMLQLISPLMQELQILVTSLQWHPLFLVQLVKIFLLMILSQVPLKAGKSRVMLLVPPPFLPMISPLSKKMDRFRASFSSILISTKRDKRFLVLTNLPALLPLRLF